MCFVAAWLINELNPKVRTILTLMFYAPSISANAYLMWTLLFSGDSYGYINGHPALLGRHRQAHPVAAGSPVDDDRRHHRGACG